MAAERMHGSLLAQRADVSAHIPMAGRCNRLYIALCQAVVERPQLHPANDVRVRRACCREITRLQAATMKLQAQMHAGVVCSTLVCSWFCFKQVWGFMQMCQFARPHHQGSHLRMSKRSAGEGTATSSSLSKRPGRRRAESRAAMRLVAAITTTPEVPVLTASQSLSELSHIKTSGHAALFLGWLAFEKVEARTSWPKALLWANGKFPSWRLKHHSGISDSEAPSTVVSVPVECFKSPRMRNL